MLATGDRGSDQPSSHEAALLDYAARLAQHRIGRKAVHLCVSRLAPVNRREHHIRIAMNTFEPLLKRFEGQLFRMWNNDLIVAVKDATISEIDDYVIKLQFLFAEDPLLAEEPEDSPGFCTWFEMESDYPKFKELSETFQRQAEAARKRAAENAAKSSSSPFNVQPTAEAPTQPLTPLLLDRFEQALSTADLGTMVQQQMICAFPTKHVPTPVMCEHFVSIQALQKQFLPGIDCLSDRWLFQHLCESLDYRMLVALPEIAKTVNVPITINITVSTLLSAEFLKFDAAFRRFSQKTVILELQSIDLFGDMGSYLFARDFVRDRGYGLALDGLNQITFPLIDRKQLMLDFQKILWSPEIASDVRAERRKEFSEAIARADPNRVILCRCDNQDALDFGHSVGIRLFQGRYVDHLLATG